MPPERTRWNDERLDEMSTRVAELSRVPVVLAEMKGEHESLKTDLSAKTENLQHELQAEDGAVGRLHGALRSLTGDPVADKRHRRDALVLACVGSFVGALGASIIFFIAGGH